MDKYANFLNQIPSDIMQEVDYDLFSDIAIFRPGVYVERERMNSADFHIIVSPTPPPDTYINDKLRSFDYGKIMVINPGDTILCPEAYPTKQYLDILIRPELINKIAEEIDAPNNIRFLNIQNPFSYELIETIKKFDKECKRQDKFKLMLDCLGIEIAVMLLREFKSTLKKYPSYSCNRETYIQKAIEYMNVFFSSNITIEDICKEINISPFYFIRTFKQKTGISPHQYLLNIRIKKAKELLKIKQYSITEAAMMSGFVNLSHFSNTFKIATGTSPSEYRKMLISYWKAIFTKRISNY